MIRMRVLIYYEILFVAVNYSKSSSYESHGVLACAHVQYFINYKLLTYKQHSWLVQRLNIFLPGTVLGLKFSKFIIVELRQSHIYGAHKVKYYVISVQ